MGAAAGSSVPPDRLPSSRPRPHPLPYLQPQRRAQRRPQAIGLAVGLGALLVGCGPLPPPPQTLHVWMVPMGELDWLQDDNRDSQTWAPLLEAFRRQVPGASVQITIQPEQTLASRLQLERSRGLGPDLLLLRAPVANAMLARGLVEPLPAHGPLATTLALVQPTQLRRVTTANGLAGLPVFTEVTLACHDRRRVPRSPATLAELLALAASGRPVGLSVDASGLWWTAGALGAQHALEPIITRLAPTATLPAAERSAGMRAWLTWLRQAALQSRVDVASGSRELTEGLESGRLAWIPCATTTLQRLNRTMGHHLGVAPLPSGPAGPPSPFTALRVLALGTDSSPRQRQLALALAQLSLNPLVQRDLTLRSKKLVPVNRYVTIPVASSGRLAALAAAEGQFLQTTPLMMGAFSSDDVNRVLGPLETTVAQVMAGILTVDQGVEQLEALGRRSLVGGRP